VDKVIPKGKLTDSVFRGQIDKYLKTEMDKAKNAEAAKFNAYVSKESKKAQVTTSGLNYVVTQAGSGPKAAMGDTVVVNYTGRFLTGKVFDTSIIEVAKKEGTFNAQRPYEPLKMPVGMNGSIPGFEEGLMLFPAGTKAKLILPSKLGYGEQGSQGIAPYTPLIFEIEIVKIIPVKAGSVTPPVAPVR
jgi:FKBP-type peptidyl-prolyl cis-trans isomerase